MYTHIYTHINIITHYRGVITVKHWAACVRITIELNVCVCGFARAHIKERRRITI